MGRGGGDEREGDALVGGAGMGCLDAEGPTQGSQATRHGDGERPPDWPAPARPPALPPTTCLRAARPLVSQPARRRPARRRPARPLGRARGGQPTAAHDLAFGFGGFGLADPLGERAERHLIASSDSKAGDGDLEEREELEIAVPMQSARCMNIVALP